MSTGTHQCPGCGEICMGDERCDCACTDQEPWNWRDEMPRCATCKHWDQTVQRENLERYELLKAQGSWVVAYSDPEHERHDAEFGDCAMLHDTELIKNQDHVDQWWDTPLQTHRTFGCILHEPRE